MTSKEKARLRGEPIPSVVPTTGNTEFIELALTLQVSRIVRRCAVSAAAAELLAPLVFGSGEGRP